MAQTIAKFLAFEKKGNIRKSNFVVYKMENQEGWFWCSFTEEKLLNSSKENLEGKLILLSGKWRELDKQEWNGWGFKCEKSYLLFEGDFFINSWEKKEKESMPEKSLREIL